MQYYFLIHPQGWMYVQIMARELSIQGKTTEVGFAQARVREVNRGDLALVDWLWRQKRAVALRTSAKFTTVMFLIID